MKFCEAMEELKSGNKVTRQPWIDGLYFLLDGEQIKSYQPVLRHYNYTEDIMVSNGWLIEGKECEYNFCDIIYLLQMGYKAKLKEWKDSYIYLDPTDKVLAISSMEVFPFMPQFSDFIAEDWVKL